jgi:hypothetical protein
VVLAVVTDEAGESTAAAGSMMTARVQVEVSLRNSR